MKYLKFVVFCLFSLNFVISQAFAQDFNFQAATGSYTGEVLNGGTFDPYKTQFSLSSDGRLTGEYTIDDELGVTAGVLTNVRVEGPYTIVFEWTDKDGEGLERLVFSEDYQQFEGYWGMRSSPDRFPLNGKK